MVDDKNISEKFDDLKAETNNNSEKIQEEKQQVDIKNKEEEKPKKTFFKNVKKPKDKEKEDLILKVAELNDKYIRLSAEFDNYRKRSLKEKMEIIKAGGENILLGILPVIDDFERAIIYMNQTEDINAVKEGINLIYSKFKEFISQKGIKEIESKNQEFNTDLHEAITKIPAPEEALKGKIVDVIQKGYFLNDKVIRFSKVVIGE